MRRLLVLASAVTALLAVALCLPGAARADTDPYSPTVPTSCHVSVPTAVVGKRVVVRVSVEASDGQDPRGTVRLTLSSERWARTFRYDGTPLRIVGPRLAPGKHVARVHFVPKGDRYAGCRDQAPFGIGGDDAGPSEDLPNTGGPHLLVLLSGLGLVAAGGGLVEVGRRRA
ncbi:hypothetical protein GUY44_25290 [Pimelobacter simplex]|uniref:hypothetical protein n=1 Tax=Nocardioides simplex TaxID=2045 RepID=UPI0008F20191|nr:hypothetical protein [Pimelobacter simplex]MCG8153814.1 hypothetical protein [Pimelobacter simplex]GEB16245.1 hypothetical protein NSI01_45600 [Pimelobacter simplex]SFM34384.1 hypothetical protein SAMN05421671_1358 [Pimelobacter simplex]